MSSVGPKVIAIPNIFEELQVRLDILCLVSFTFFVANQSCFSQDVERELRQLKADLATLESMRMSLSEVEDELTDIAKTSDINSLELERLYRINEQLSTQPQDEEVRNAVEPLILELRSLASKDSKSKEIKAILFAILFNADHLANSSTEINWELVLNSDIKTKLAFSEQLGVVQWTASKDFISVSAQQRQVG